MSQICINNESCDQYKIHSIYFNNTFYRSLSPYWKHTKNLLILNLRSVIIASHLKPGRHIGRELSATMTSKYWFPRPYCCMFAHMLSSFSLCFWKVFTVHVKCDSQRTVIKILITGNRNQLDSLFTISSFITYKKSPITRSLITNTYPWKYEID